MADPISRCRRPFDRPHASLAFAIAIMAVVAPGTSDAQNLFSNGSFEDGAAIPPGSFLGGLGPGNASITDWTIVDGNIDYIGTLWDASDGSRSLDMSGNGPAGSIGQAVSTSIGHRYRVRFDLAGNFGTPGIKRLQVAAADVIRLFDFDATGRSANDMGWVSHEFEFIAGAISTPVYFTSITAGGFGPALDNVFPLPPS